jgi:release factor glutamine methyltransferase
VSLENPPLSYEYKFEHLLNLLKKDLNILPDKSEENPENTLRALWHLAAGRHLSPIVSGQLQLPSLTEDQFARLDELFAQRLAGVPLAHLTERQHFLGMEFIVNKGLYIPRKETELLANIAIQTLASYTNTTAPILMDLCTGIGTVALAAAYHCNSIRVVGSDIYAPAIDAAHVNAKHFGLTEQATFFNADLFTPFEHLKGLVDLVVSAPPYITTAKVKSMADEISQHEPEEAFNAGPFGLSIFNQLIELSPVYLRSGGFLIFECGLGQGEFLAKRIAANKHYKNVEQLRDDNDNVRVLKAAIVS